jgi:hypothetical protein
MKKKHKSGSKKTREIKANTRAEPKRPNEGARGDYKLERSTFLPLKSPVGWDDEQDMRDYEARFDESANPLRESRRRLDQNFTELHRVLASGINYFLKKGGAVRLAPVSPLSLREKIELFSDLLPNSANTDYVLRFTTTLARILWLESERSRILAQRDGQPWLYPLYHLCDCVATTGLDLKDALSREHDDFDQLCARQVEDDEGAGEEAD